MKLSVLDQSPVIAGHSAAQAVAETLALAHRVEALGYHRYWLAEHHAIAALADPCPEVLLARLGAETRRMRVGTGGVLLPYYSAFKVAEVFRMLDAMYPGRVDLGIGRAPGGDVRTARAVSGGHFPDAERFPQQVWELAGHLCGTLPENHPDRLRRNLDCAVIRRLHSILEDQDLAPVDTLRGVFIEGKPVYPGAGFDEKTHIQVVVRNPDCIKGVFRVPRGRGGHPKA